jgi:hypothetical protein
MKSSAQKIESLEAMAKAKFEQIKSFCSEMDLIEVSLPENMEVVSGKIHSFELKGTDIILTIIPPYECQKISVKLIGGERIAITRTKVFRI